MNVVQPNCSHDLLCVCVCVCVCDLFIDLLSTETTDTCVNANGKFNL